MAVYDITFEVTDPQLTAVELRKALAQFGEVLEITKWKSGDVDDLQPLAAEFAKTKSN